ncbi:CheR family methyltransferase [Leptospira sp. 'Mane']|uniref:CheR family methyltransferase n=1 Tax=Leptospira sp. 'Mane' TaxID=3387407 RepID=UPI00398A5BEB
MIESYYQALSESLLQKTGIRIDAKEKWNLIRNHFREFELAPLLENPNHPLWDKLFNVLNISETYFNRDPIQLRSIFYKILPDYIKNTGKRKLSVWSAGSSTGEEAYTLALFLQSMKDEGEIDDYHVIGSDLQKKSVDIAKKGEYSTYSIRNDLPNGFSEFLILSESSVRVRADIRSKVEFREGNLLNPVPEIFDLIVCRNVFIYLDEISKQNILTQFYHSLYPFGNIILGHAEYNDSPPNDLKVISIASETSYFQKSGKEESSKKETITHSKGMNHSEHSSSERISHRQARSNRETSDRPTERVSQISSGLPLSPGETKESSLLLAFQEKERGNSEQAHFFWKQALYEDPYAISAYYELANYFWEKGDRKTARSYQAQAWTVLKNDPARVDFIKKSGNWVSEWDEFLNHSL